jgi:hypothetical protein
MFLNAMSIMLGEPSRAEQYLSSVLHLWFNEVTAIVRAHRQPTLEATATD